MAEENHPATVFVTRWDSLLAENSILHKAHLDLVSSFAPPFSAQQTAQLAASAARFGTLSPKVQRLVEDWAESQFI